jgi:diadenosine tetraphosphatase ApaH/serine/threonine PP2A family protein phosphatase
MKLAIISDIHGNLEALNAVLEDVQKHPVEEIVCLGDVVGYGADPSACLHLVQDRCSAVLLGNHDEAAADLSKAYTFNPIARAAVQWTSETLSEAERESLAKFPFTSKRGSIFLVHASPHNPEEWEYIIDDYDAQQVFDDFTEKICCVGHSHIVGIYPQFDDVNPADPRFKCVVNVGSVGQPRDKDPRSAWCLIDTESFAIEVFRVEYDIETAARKIRLAGLPFQLAERLSRGI